MKHVALGTAQLFGLAGSVDSEGILWEAWRCGIRRFDTAPSYGSGRSEENLGKFLAGREGVEAVTTKVGLVPLKGPVRGWKVAGDIAKQVLPKPITQRLRSALITRGHFGVDDVRASVDESLRRLNGRIDRLLLHEVAPHDITDDLLRLLERYLHRGDVGTLGVATQNHLTLPALARGGTLFTVAHIAIGPMDTPVSLPAQVTIRVGHGLLGGCGGQLRALRKVLNRNPDLFAAWSAATAGTDFAGEGGLTRALLSRGSGIDVTDLIVATTRVQHLAPAFALAAQAEPLPAPIVDVLGRLVRETHAMAT